MLEVVRYEEKDEALWDRFVQGESVNGTFLQTRNFLNYHPKGRFQDHSLLVWADSKKLYAVIPACEAAQGNQKALVSHQGSTYGGLVISPGCYHKAQDMEELLCAFDAYWQNEGFSQVELRMTPGLFAREDPALLEYFMKYHNYQECTELGVYLDFNRFEDDIPTNFNQNKRRLLKKMQGMDLQFVELCTQQEIASFHDLLCRNLKKFHTVPVHTVEELVEFRNSRLTDIVRFYGVVYQGELLAGCMCFDFDHRVLHTQYLASDPFRESIPGVDAMTYLYYKVIAKAKQDGYSALSFGICTEEKGKELNFGLLRNKASFGGRYCINRTFTKQRRVACPEDPSLLGNVYIPSSGTN